MATQLFSNNARVILSEVLGISDVVIETATTQAFSSPLLGQYELATLRNSDGSLIEIVKITAFDGDGLFTVERAQEGTSALTWPVGTVMEGTITAGTLDNFAQGLGASGAVAGDSIALNGTQNRVGSTFMVGAFPCVKMDDWDDAGEQYSQAPETVMCSPYFDLGVPPTWQSNTQYYHGDIVQPTVPDGFQYRAYLPDNPAILTTKVVGTSHTTEPVWDSSVQDLNITWIQQSPSVGYFMQSPPGGSVFIPTLFGFISHATVVGPLTAMNVMVGTALNEERYVAAVDGVVEVANQNEYCVWPVGFTRAVTATEQIRFILDTASTTGRCVGRFFARGFFVELPVHD